MKKIMFSVLLAVLVPVMGVSAQGEPPGETQVVITVVVSGGYELGDPVTGNVLAQHTDPMSGDLLPMMYVQITVHLTSYDGTYTGASQEVVTDLDGYADFTLEPAPSPGTYMVAAQVTSASWFPVSYSPDFSVADTTSAEPGGILIWSTSLSSRQSNDNCQLWSKLSEGREDILRNSDCILLPAFTFILAGDLAGIISMPGDANGDGLVNALDITQIERILAELDTSTSGADANQDGSISTQDVNKVVEIIAGGE